MRKDICFFRKENPMKKLLSLILCLGLMGLTAACGPSGEPDPDTVPAPEIVDAETIQADPFAVYFDLSGLSQETLDGAIQDINKENLPIRITQSLGDGQSLYIAFDVVWRPNTDPFSEVIQPTLTVGDPNVASDTYAGMVTNTNTVDNTCSYIVSFSDMQRPYTGEPVTLTIPVMENVYAFNWTAKNITNTSTVNLEDSEGTVVGQASLTPFSLQFTISDSYISGIAHGDTIQLLDETGAPLPETWAISGDPSAAFLEFFVPMELGTVKTLQVGPYTAHF